jgi:hypothetical protein
MLQKRDERIATHLPRLRRQYRELQKKCRANREHCTTLRQGYYLIAWAWCKRRMALEAQGGRCPWRYEPWYLPIMFCGHGKEDQSHETGL